MNNPPDIGHQGLNTVYTGDLLQLRRHGVLRILVPGRELSSLSSVERELLSRYASSQQLTPVWIPVQQSSIPVSSLLKGHGDLIASYSQVITEAPISRILSTQAWGVSRQVIVGRSGSNRINAREELLVRQIALKRSSPAWAELADMAGKAPGMELIVIPEETDIDAILDKVGSGYYDLAVVESLQLPENFKFRFNLETLMSVTEDETRNWAVRPDSTALQRSLNKFLNENHLQMEISRSYREDLPELKKRKVLRLITRRGPATYFQERGRLKGFEYELIERFAELHEMRLDVVIADTLAEMEKLLVEGKGDIIAASMPESRYSRSTEVKISDPYNYAMPALIGRDDESITDFRGLSGRTIYLSSESPYLPVLSRIKSQGNDFNIMVSETNLGTEAVLFRVAQGILDLTVIGSNEIAAELSRQFNLKAHIILNDPQPLVWAARKSGTLLISALNDYIEAEYRKGFYNVLYARYIDNPYSRKADSGLLSGIERLSPYDDIVLEYADHYSFDWRLIVAQMYHESHFNPDAVSSAGAEGLMQLLPTTAAMIGIDRLDDPESNILGGIQYMDYLRGMFEEELSPEDRTWFTLAAYNAGYNRIRQARDLAREMNLDGNRWFDNVETAMLKLAGPFRDGDKVVRNCRCGQTVVYVREIKTLYNNYLRLSQSVKAAARTVPVSEES